MEAARQQGHLREHSDRCWSASEASFHAGSTTENGLCSYSTDTLIDRYVQTPRKRSRSDAAIARMRFTLPGRARCIPRCSRWRDVVCLQCPCDNNVRPMHSFTLSRRDVATATRIHGSPSKQRRKSPTSPPSSNHDEPGLSPLHNLHQHKQSRAPKTLEHAHAHEIAVRLLSKQ